MSFSPVLIFHIYSGSMALLSGAAAMFFRKGSRRHRLAGDAFVLSMIGLGTSGAFMGFMRHEPMNVAMGVLTGYLVVTAWMTARRKEGEKQVFDWCALAVPLAVAAALLTSGFAAAN